MFKRIKVLGRAFSTAKKKDVKKIVPKKHKYDIENESWVTPKKNKKKDEKKK